MKTTPYTYLVKHIPSGKVYYGSRSRKGCVPSDLFTKYFTSSKIVQNLIKLDGIMAFEFEIRKVFDNVDKCRKWEHKVLQRMKVDCDDRFLNIATMKHIKTGMMTGKRWITNGKICKPIDPLCEIPNGWYYGQPKSKFGKKDHTRGTIWINDGYQEKCHRTGDIPVGWVKGRLYRTNLDPQFWKGKTRPDHAKKISSLVWCNNGKIVKRFSPESIPDGFTLGRKLR